MSTLRALEKQCHELVKLRLDVKHPVFETCLGLCPEFLKFKIPTLNGAKDGKDLYPAVVRKKSYWSRKW